MSVFLCASGMDPAMGQERRTPVTPSSSSRYHRRRSSGSRDERYRSGKRHRDTTPSFHALLSPYISSSWCPQTKACLSLSYFHFTQNRWTRYLSCVNIQYNKEVHYDIKMKKYELLLVVISFIIHLISILAYVSQSKQDMVEFVFSEGECAVFIYISMSKSALSLNTLI